ncbi:nucleotidyltransferase domain-containing protein [Rhizobium ruizarguesonis]|nr:hypothetical protein [Rhizobium leguminosarum bv. viciae]
MTLPTAILNISLFGSTSRNDDDLNSDLDVLVVVANGTGKTSPDVVVKFVQEEFGRAPSLSWYGMRKMAALFQSGDLFAWHLHLEAKTLAGTSLNALMGVPSDYTNALSDINDLRGITSRVEQSVTACGANAVFEMGILYVCARNIAMAASWRLAPRPSFGRYSPYDLPIPFPITHETYEIMLQCRMASQRGTRLPAVCAPQVLEVRRNILIWAKVVASEVAKVEATDEQIPTF